MDGCGEQRRGPAGRARVAAGSPFAAEETAETALALASPPPARSCPPLTGAAMSLTGVAPMLVSPGVAGGLGQRPGDSADPRGDAGQTLWGGVRDPSGVPLRGPDPGEESGTLLGAAEPGPP